MPSDLEVYLQRRGKEPRKIEYTVSSQEWPNEITVDDKIYHFRFADLSRGFAIYHEDRPMVWEEK